MKKFSRPKFIPLPLGSSGLGWHQIQPFIHCPKEYQFSRVRNIVPVAETLADPLAEGLLLHAMRAQWLYDGRSVSSPWQLRARQYVEEYNAQPNAPKITIIHLELSIATFQGYVDYWATRPTTEVLAVEYELSPRKVHHSLPDWVQRTARLDSIERWQGETWIGECKSTRDSVEALESTYSLHGQILLQLCLYGDVETKKFGPLAGVLLDPILKPGMRRKAPSGGPRLELRIDKLAHALAWFREDFKTWVMHSSSIRWDDKPERRPVCMRQYGPCAYRELCTHGRDGTSPYVFAETNSPIIHWEPSPGKMVPPWE